MKKVIRVITVLAIVASFSSSAYAANKNGWDFLTTLFTGEGLDPNCTSINASPAQIFATKNKTTNFSSITTNKDGSSSTTTFTND